MPPTPTIQDLENDVAAKAQAVSDAQADHAEAAATLQAAKDATSAQAPETPQAGSVPVSEVVPAPTATPAMVQAPELEKFSEPMHLVTKKQDAPSDPVATYDPATGEFIDTLPADTPFEAIGKYVTPQTTYYSDGTHSVKTVDLSTAHEADAPAAGGDDQGEKIEVKVIPAAPDAWQVMSDTFLGPVQYRVKGSFMVKDLSGIGEDVAVTPETHTPGKEGLDIGGRFTGPDGVAYYRAQSSVDNGTWYGFPVETLQPLSDPDDDLTLDDLFDPNEAKAAEAAAGYGTKTHKVAAAAGTSVGLLSRLRGKK